MYFFVCVHVCGGREGCVYVNAGTHRGQKGATDALELTFYFVVSYPMWLLGTVLCSSSRSVYVLNLQAVSPALQL